MSRQRPPRPTYRPTPEQLRRERTRIFGPAFQRMNEIVLGAGAGKFFPVDGPAPTVADVNEQVQVGYKWGSTVPLSSGFVDELLNPSRTDWTEWVRIDPTAALAELARLVVRPREHLVPERWR